MPQSRVTANAVYDMENSFGERLFKLRREARLSREALGQAAHITGRSIQNYESGSRYPNSLEIVKRLADALGTTSAYLLGDEGAYIQQAQKTGDAAAVRDVRALVEEVRGLFAGGELPDEDKDALMSAITQAYFESKEWNKKFGHKNNP